MDKRERKNARMRSLRAVKIPPGALCEQCNWALGSSPRHHPDIESRPEWVILLCDACHLEADVALGNRSRGARREARDHGGRGAVKVF